MMHLLADRFGTQFMGDFHRDDLHGFESLQSLMTAAGGPSVSTMIDTWAASAALDGVLDDGAKLHGGNASDYRVSTLDETHQLGQRPDATAPRELRRTDRTSSAFATDMDT